MTESQQLRWTLDDDNEETKLLTYHPDIPHPEIGPRHASSQQHPCAAHEYDVVIDSLQAYVFDSSAAPRELPNVFLSMILYEPKVFFLGTGNRHYEICVPSPDYS